MAFGHGLDLLTAEVEGDGEDEDPTCEGTQGWIVGSLISFETAAFLIGCAWRRSVAYSAAVHHLADVLMESRQKRGESLTMDDRQAVYAWILAFQNDLYSPASPAQMLEAWDEDHEEYEGESLKTQPWQYAENKPAEDDQRPDISIRAFEG